MNKLLLLRYRALASKIIRYIFGRGAIYSKLFGLSNGRDCITQKGSGKSIYDKMYQIANGILCQAENAILYTIMGIAPDYKAKLRAQYITDILLKSIMRTTSNSKAMPKAQYVADILMHSLMGSAPDYKAKLHVQYVEDILIRSVTKTYLTGFGRLCDAVFRHTLSLTKTYMRGSGHTLHIVFGRAMDLTRLLVVSLGRAAIAEHRYTIGTIRCLYKCASNAAFIVFGRGQLFDELIVDGGLRLVNISYGAGVNFIKVYPSASPNDAAISFGRGLISAKVGGNSGISMEDPVVIRMYWRYKIKEEHDVKPSIQGLENILYQSCIKMLSSNAGCISLDMRLKLAGLIQNYLISIGHMNLSDTIHTCGTIDNKSETRGGVDVVEYGDAAYWKAPIVTDDTIYIRSVYTINHNDSTVYLK